MVLKYGIDGFSNQSINSKSGQKISNFSLTFFINFFNFYKNEFIEKIAGKYLQNNQIIAFLRSLYDAADL